MIKIRNNCFETNSSSTHALILNNDDYYNKVSELDLLILSHLPELEMDIKIFTGEPDDKTYEGKEYSTYEGSFSNIIDKIRYLYTCMCQDGLYEKDDDGNIIIDEGSKAYNIYIKLKDFMPKLNFIPPKDGYCYVFEDCEYVINDFYESNLFKELRTLGLFLLKGRITYCNRDDDYQLSEELHEIVKENNKGSLITGG